MLTRKLSRLSRSFLTAAIVVSGGLAGQVLAQSTPAQLRAAVDQDEHPEQRGEQDAPLVARAVTGAAMGVAAVVVRMPMRHGRAFRVTE